MDEELCGLGLLRRFWAGDVGDDGLADAADAVDAGAGESFDDLGFGGLEGLGLAAGPDAEDALAADAGVDTVGYGFYFGELWHRDKDTRCERREARDERLRLEAWFGVKGARGGGGRGGAVR